ncbi:unnamed protein product [Sphagnum balticum]
MAVWSAFLVMQGASMRQWSLSLKCLVNQMQYYVGPYFQLHSTFGLISTSPGTPICIFRNFQTCENCYIATRFISKLKSS